MYGAGYSGWAVVICVWCGIQWVGYDFCIVSCAVDNLYMVHYTVDGLNVDLCIVSGEHCHSQCLCYLTTGRIGVVVEHMFIQ